VKLVYRVKIDIQNPNMELKPGMPADAVILTGPDTNTQSQTMALLAREVSDARN
jgi:hypothetical protein